MNDKILYVVQYKTETRKRWKDSFWTRGGRPVSKRAAEKAMATAQKKFPKSEYRVSVFKGATK